MEAQQFSLLIDQSGATDLPAGLTPEQFGALVQHPDGLLEVLPWLCRQAIRVTARGAGCRPHRAVPRRPDALGVDRALGPGAR